MNRIYKIIWSEARKCYVVVSEIAKNHGKNNVKTVVSQLAARTLGAMRQLAAAIQSGGRRSLPVLAERPHTAAQWIVPLVLAGILLQAVPAYASKITDWPGGKTSLINTSDNVHDLYLQELVTPKNHTDKNFGVNRFTDYQVTDGDIVNMHFQSRNGALKTDSLVNLVQNRININGIVNGIKDGRIGGDLYFISPNGLAVGNKGVINTGKLFAFAPSSGYFDNLAWNHDSLASAFINDFQNFGTRDENGKLKDTGMKWNTDKDKGISIEGQINARSGIVLGAGHIAIKDGAVLKSSKDLDFTNLVNVKDDKGEISVKNTTLEGANLTAVKDAKSGDIILRAEYEDHYKAKLYVPDEYIAAGKTTGTAEITVEGSVDGDGNVDISASSTMTFTNRNWEGVDGIPQLGTEVLSDLGINVAADVAVKHNTASVSVAETGSVKAGEKATLQADAVVSVNIQAQTANVKDDGTPGTPGTEETLGTPGTPGSSSALPVASVAVAKVNNKALVDIAGKVNSGQDMKLDALADTTEVTTSNAITKAKEGDTDSSVYFAGSFLYGNTLAEINVKAKSEDTLTAGGQFTAEAEALSGVAAMAVAAGLDESVASTAVAVVDYNSAANVNLERSVVADSIGVKAENAVELMGVLADNHIGEGNKPVLDYHVKGETNPAVVTKKLQTFLNSKLDGSGWSVSGFRQGGVLSAMEGMFEKALDYVTVGAAIGVLNNTNTANVTVAPGVKLEAKKTEKTQDETSHDVILEAVTDLKAFSHQVTGEANKPDSGDGSKFTVAAAVLDSNIRNDAAVVLQSKDGKGVNLVALNGSVQLKADARIGDSTYFSPLSALEYQMASQLDESGHISLKPGEMGIEQVWDELISTFNKMGKDASKLKKWKKETVKIEKEAADGKITNNERATDKAKALAEFFTFLYSEGEHLRDTTQEVKKLITTLTDYLSPASYTNYYVRSYTVDGQQSDKTNYDLAGSFNISVLENKGVVAVGENSSVKAGKDISISSDTRTEAISATGNAGEYLAFSESTGTGIGASLAVHDTNTDSMIITGKNVTLTAGEAGAGSIKLASDAKADEVGIIYSAGEAQKNGVEASIGVQAGGASSLVLVDDETDMTAAGDVTLAANNSLKAVNVVGGLALGSSDATFTVGAGVAVNGLEANSMAVIGDNGTEEVEKNGKTIIQIANQEIEDPKSKDNKDKTDEEKNAIKAKNTLAKARKLAADRAVVRSMGSDFKSAETKLTGYLGGKTEDGADKKTVTGQDVTVKANNSGSINSVAVESVNNAKQHKALDALNHYSAKLLEEGKAELTTTLMNAVSWPMDKFNSIFNGKGSTDHTWDFGNHKPITWQDGSSPTDSFNIAAAGSVAWNHNDHETAAVIDRMNVTLNYKTDRDGKLLNAATEDIFTGAWAGADAINWFSGTASFDFSGTTSEDTASRGSHKTGLGAAVAINDLNRNVNALISNSSISQAGLLENTAVKNGAEAAGALGLAITNDSGSTTARDVNVIFGLSLNNNKGDVHALLLEDTSVYEKNEVKDAKGKTVYTYQGATDVSVGAYDGDIQVAGSVDLNVLKAGGLFFSDTGGIAVGINASVSDLANDIRSGIQGGSYTGAGNINVAGEEAFTQVNVAAGLDVDQSAKGFSGTGSLALGFLSNNTRSLISGTEKIEASGDVSVTSRDISGNDKNPYKEYLKKLKKDPEGTSYLSDTEKNNLGKEAASSIVTVAADVTEGTQTAAGASLTVAEITNRFASDVTGNKSLTAGSVKASADVHTDIVSVAAGVSVSEKTFGGVGSLSFNDLNQDNIVSITGNRNGDAAGSGITAGEVDGTAKNTSHIVNVTGDFAGGKNAVGLGMAYNRMDDTTGVYAGDNRIAAKDAGNGVGISLDADNTAYALALSIGAAVTYKDDGKVAALGNFAVNRGHNDTVAVIGEDKNGYHWENGAGSGSQNWAIKDTITNASSVSVKATDKTGKNTAAGAAELAVADTTVALGVGVALTESDKGSETGNGKETVRAEINYADITTVEKDGKAPAISATTADTSWAKTVAVGIGVTTESKVGAQGVGADANIYKTNTAGLKDTTIDRESGSREALVTVKAETASTLKTGASALQLTGKESYLAGVVAVGVNRIKDTTSAGVTYAEKPSSVAVNAGNLDISAASGGNITSVAAGVSGTWEGTAALGGSGSHNFIENNATATIKNANISSTGNVGVVAQSDEAISNYAGLLDVNAGGQGVALAIGVTGSTNQISGATEALIDNSTVAAAGSDDESKAIKTKSKLKNNTKDDKYLIEGAVTNNTWKSGKLQTGRDEEKKSGVVVDASATHAIASVMANGGVAVGVGEGSSGAVDVAGVVNLNTVGGETGAKILDSDINTETSRSDVTVHAADYTNAAEFSGVAAVDIGKTFGVTVGFTGTGNTVDRVTSAGVSTSKVIKDESTGAYVAPSEKNLNTVYAKNFAVTADTKHAMSAFNVTAAVAGSTNASVETGDNVNVNKMYSSTLATVTNTTVYFTKSATVRADNEDRIYNLNIGAGVAGAADAAVSVNLGIGTVDADAAVTANVENSKLEASNQTTDKDADLTVAAANKTVLETTLASAGIAGSLYSGSLAGSIAVNNISNRITSRVRNSTLTADNISVNTFDEIQLKDATGEGAGALAIGIGAGVDVSTLNDSVSTIVDNSTLTAKKNLAVDTTTKRNLAATVAGAGVAAGTIQVNVLAVTVNSGIGNLNDNNGSTFNHQEKVKSMLETVNGEINDDVEKDEIRYLFKNVQGLTDDQKKDMKKKLEAGAKEGDKAGGVHTYVQNGSKLDAGGDLSIYNFEQNDADLNGGSGAFGLGDIIVSDVVVHLNQLNDIALTGSSVTGGSVSLMAEQGNEKDNKDDSIHARTVQVSGGIADIGVGYAGITTKGKTGVSVNNDSAITATDGVTLKSLDKARSKAELLGISVAVANIPISLAHNTNTASNFVTVTGGSTLKPQDVTDSKGNKTGEKDLAYISLQSERSGKVTAKTTAVGAGGVEVAVNEAKARDAGAATVQVEGGGNQFKADRITLEANNHPQVKVDAGSTDVALLGISVRHSSARAESKAYVMVADGNTLLGDSVEAKAVIGKDGEVMSDAKTHGTNVSVVSVAPNSANAETQTEAKVNMGNETYKTVAKETQQTGATAAATEEVAATSLSLVSLNNASRHAVIDYTTVGLGVEFMPAGDGDAKPIGEDQSSVEAKGGTSVDTPVKLASLEILAGGSNVARGLSDSSSGGAVSLSAKASADMTTKTKNTASLSGAWDVAGKAEIGSKQKVTAKGTSESGAGGVLNAVWSHSHNQVEMDTQTKIAENAVLKAGESYVTATSTVVTGAYGNEHWNNYMEVEGLMQVDEVKSKTDVKSANTVEIGKNAKVNTENGQVYEAHTDLDIANKVEGVNGGGAADQGVYSNNKVTSANNITVDEGAKLNQDGAYKSGNDITLSSSDTITMDTIAEGYTYGFAGVLVSNTNHDVTRNNSVTVKGELSSTHDVNLYAGANADGSASNLNINSLSNSHNRTFLTWPADPKIELDLKNKQQVQVESDGKVTSVRNINVTADSGVETVRKDLRRVASLVFKEGDGYATLTNQSPGVSKIEEKNDNFVKVDGQLKSGLQNNVKIDITGVLLPEVTIKNKVTGQEVVHTFSPVAEDLPDFNIEITNDSGVNTDLIIKKEDITYGSVNYASQLKAQYDVVTKLIEDYSGDTDSAAYLGYVQRRQRIIDEMEKRGLLAEVTDRDGNQVKLVSEMYPVSYVEIPSFGVSGGSIVVQSDTLYGKGKLETNGSPRIEINNLSNAYLVLDGLEVGENGGEIRFHQHSIDAGVKGKTDIENLNTDKDRKVEFTSLQSEDSSNSVSRISVLNDNGRIGTAIEVIDQLENTATYTAIPDMVIRGDITDDSGDVRIENRQGSIAIASGDENNSANISARTVKVIAVQGSISQDAAGIVNIGGNPEDLNRRAAEEVIGKAGLSGNSQSVKVDIPLTDSDAAAGRIAGDSVYLSADSINVNGLLQSGYSKYVADIPEDALSEANLQKLQNNGSEVMVQGCTMYKVNDGNKAVYDADSDTYNFMVQVYYNPETKGLVVEDIDTKGGKVYLTGQISSTGNGRILAVDGGAEISITNNTSADLTTGKIINNDIEGRITITDLAKDTWTEYTRTGANSMSLAAYGKYLTLSDAEKTKFATLSDAGKAEMLGYTTEEQKKQAQIQSGKGIGYYNGSDTAGIYSVKEGLRYNWTLGQTKSKTTYFEKVTSTLFWGGAKVKTKEELSEYENSSDVTKKEVTRDGVSLPDGTYIDDGTISGKYADYKNETVELDASDERLTYLPHFRVEEKVVKGGRIVTITKYYLSETVSYNLVDSDFGAVLQSTVTDSTERVNTGEWKESGHWYAFWSDPRYHTTWQTTEGSTQTYTFSQKADRDIAVGFIGKENGSISVKNTNTSGGDILLNGNIRNNTKDATLTVAAAGGSIIQKDAKKDGKKNDTSLTTASADLQAKNDIKNIHIVSLGERTDTGKTDSAGNKIYTTNDGVKLRAVSYNGGSIDVHVTGGSVEGQTLPGNVEIVKLVSKAPQDGSGKPGNVTLSAQGNITPQFVSLGQQFRDNDGNVYTSVDAYLQQDATYQALPESQRQVYADKVTQEYNRFTSLQQKYTASGGTYDNVAEYLENDAAYQAKLQASADYAANIKAEYENKAGNSDLEQKYDGYDSAEAYLAQDQAYQDLLNASAVYKDNVEDEFVQFAADPVTLGYKYRDEGGNIYTSVDAYLQQDATYQALPESQRQAYADNATEEYNRFISLKQKFTKNDGTGDTYDSAASYLKQDDTYEDLCHASNKYYNDAKSDFKKFKEYEKEGKYRDKNGNVYTSLDAYLQQDERFWNMAETPDHYYYVEIVSRDYNKYKSLLEEFTKNDGSGGTYDSVEAYLAQNQTYQDLFDAADTYKHKIENEFVQFTADPVTLGQKYRDEKGRVYTSVDSYLQQNTTYQALPDIRKKAYAGEATLEYSQFTSLRQKFFKNDGSGATYVNAAEYLQNDTAYQARLQASADYAANIKAEYAGKTGSSDLEQKYAGYDSAEQYLAQDQAYQDSLYASAIYKDNIEDEFAQFTVDPLTVQGYDIQLTSTAGGIGTFKADGTPGQAIVVDSAAEAHGSAADSASVNADAKKHIYLVEKEGDMPVGSIISREGDVRLEVANGRLVDALDQSEQTNNMNEDSVVKHWIDAGLIAGTSSYEGAYITGLMQDATNYEKQVEEQIDLCKKGEANDQIKAVYMNADGTLKYTSAKEYLAHDEYYQAIVDKYTNPKFGWTKEQLLYAVRNAVVNKESGVTAETQNKKANVQAKNVTLSAKGVGMYGEEPVIISASDFKGDSDEKVARLKLLTGADATDITLKDENGNILIFSYADGKQTVKAYKSADLEQEVETNGAVAEIVIGNMSPLGVYATGKLDAAASDGNVFIAGRCNDNEKPAFSPINVGTVSASDGNDVRLYTHEGITNSAASAEETAGGNIRANNLIAYGGTKDIGARDSYLTVNLSGDLLEAAADGNVYIKNVRNDDVLRLGSAYAGDTISLESDKGFGMTETEGYYLAYLNAGKQLELKTEGVIGAEANPVRILNNGTVVSLEANNGYVKGMNGMQGDDAVMLLGDIQMNGAFQASSEGNLGVSREEVKDENGQVVSPAITGQIKAGGNVKLEAVKAVTVSGSVESTAGDITVNAGTDAAVNNSVTAQNGNITIDAVGTAAVNGNITAEDNEKRITVSGREGVTLGAQIKAGSLALTDGAYTGGGQIGLASENGSIVQTEKGVLIGSTVSAASGKAVTLTNTGNTFRVFNAEGVTYTAADMPEGRDKAIRGSVEVHTHAGNMLTAGIAGSTVVYGDVAFSNLDAGGVTVDTDLVIKAGESGESSSFTLIQDGDILVGGALHVAGFVTETSRKGSVTNEKEIEAGKDIEVTATAGNILLKDYVSAGQGIIAATTNGTLTANGKLGAGNDVKLTTTTGDITTTDDITAAQDVVLGSEGGNISQTGKIVATRDLSVTTKGIGSISLDASAEDKEILAGRDITLGTEKADLTVKGNVTATAGSATVTTTAGAIGLGGDVVAGEDITATTTSGTLTANGKLGAGKDVKLTTAAGSITADETIDAGNDVKVDTFSGAVTLKGKTTAKNDITVTSDSGALTANSKLDAGKDVKLTTTTGDITTTDDITAAQDVVLGSEGGNISQSGKIAATRDLTVTTKDTGSISLDASAEGKEILAGRDITLGTEIADLTVKGKITATAGNATVTTTAGAIGLSGDVTATAGNVAVTTTSGAIDLGGVVTAWQDITATTTSGALTASGKLDAGQDVKLTTTTGSITADGAVDAGNDVNVASASGEVTLKGKTTAKNDITITSDSGTIALEDDVKADKGITVAGKGGNIAMTGRADAGTNLTVKTTGAGTVTLGAADKDIHAGSNVELESENGQIRVDGTTNTDTGDVKATATAGNITFTKDITAGQDVLLGSEGGNLSQTGKIDAARDLSVTTKGTGSISLDASAEDKEILAGRHITLGTEKAGLTVKGNVTATAGNVAVTTTSGAIGLNGDVTAGRDITATTTSGALTANGKLDAGDDVKLATATGDITAAGTVDAGSDVKVSSTSGVVTLKGKTTAKNDITITSDSGNIALEDDAKADKVITVTAKGGNITMTSGVDAGTDLTVKTEGEGQIALGTADKEVEIHAGNSVTLVTENGQIRVDGTTKTDTGDVKATATAAGNITFTKDITATTGNATVTTTTGEIGLEGDVTARQDINATTTSGDITASGKMGAGHDVKVETESGTITLKNNVKAGNDVLLKAATTGDITADGAVDAGNDVKVATTSGVVTLKGKTTAKNDITITSDSGNIKLEDDLEAGQEITATTTSGDITANGKMGAGHDVKLSTTTGDINAAGTTDAGNDLSASSESGAIKLDGNVTAQHDILVRNSSGDINLQKTVSAGHDVAVENSSGAILMDGDVDAGNDITVKTDAGLIRMDKDVTALRDITATSDSGTIGLLGDIYAGRDVAAATGDTGLLVFSTDWSDGKHEIHAGRNVALTMGHSITYVGGKVTADTGDVSATTRKGIIVFNGAVSAGQNIEATVTEGSKNSRIRYAGDIKAGHDITATAAQGDIIYENDVTAGSSVLATADKGDVEYNTGIVAEDSVVANVKAGSIAVREDITAKQGTVTLTAAAGSVTVGENDGTGHIRAGSDIAIATEKGDTTVKTSVTSENGSVSVRSEQGNIKVGEVAVANAISAKENIDLYVADGVITVNGKTETTSGDITMQARDEDTDRNIVIAENGKLISGRDLTLKTYNGGIEVTDDTLAKRSLTVEVENRGDVTFARDVDVTGNLNAEVKQGNVTIGKKLKATESIKFGTGSGDVSVGEDITAGKNVQVETENGRIGISGKTLAASGDITLKAAKSAYVSGTTGQSIIIEDNGRVEAARDVNLISGNGDLHLTDEIVAGRDVNAITQAQGDVFMDEALNVNRNLNLQVDTGNINLKADANAGGDVKATAAGGNITALVVNAGNDAAIAAGTGNVTVQNVNAGRNATATVDAGDITVSTIIAGADVQAATGRGNVTLLSVNAGNDIDVANGHGITKADTLSAANRIGVANGDGDIVLGTVDGGSVALTNSGEEGRITADVIRTEASGNVSGTGAVDLKLGGSYVAAGSVVNKSNGPEPLGIATLGASADSAVKIFTVGTQNADGSYSGGISSGSGAVVQQLWADTGMVYIKGDTNLHISKLVMNDKLHAANDVVSVAVYGGVPVHGDERVVYWNDRSYVPGSFQESWFSGAYTDPKWMYLDLFNNGDIGSGSGVLIDAGGYSQITGGTRSVADTMRIMMRLKKSPWDIEFFDRYGLLQIDDNVSVANAAEDEIEVE